MMRCRICGSTGDVLCATRQGETIALCLACARELGRLWAAQNGG